MTVTTPFTTLETPSSRPLHPGRPQGDRQRRLLLGLIASNPGVHVLRAAYVLGLNWNTCLHHVRRLEGEGRIVMRRVQGRICLFDRTAGAASTKMAPLLLRDERNAQIAKLVLGQPGMNQKELAESVGMAASVVHRRVVRLEEAGLLHRAAGARQVTLYATDALQAAWKTHGGVFGHETPAAPFGTEGQASPFGAQASPFETPASPFGVDVDGGSYPQAGWMGQGAESTA